MMRVIGRSVLALVCIGLLALVMIWISGGFTEKIEPGVAETTQRRAGDEPTGQVLMVIDDLEEEAVGSIEARERTEVSARITARIEEVLVRAGDVVERGDPLVTLDSRDLSSRVAQATEDVTAAEAEAERAIAELDRYADLLDQGVVNQSEFDQIESAARVRRATVERARRSLEEAHVAESHADVLAPISGRVVDRQVEPGDLAAPGVPLITLYNPEALRLEAAVREGLATRLRVGDPMTVRIDTLQLETVGEIDEIVPQAETGSRSFLVKVRLPIIDGLYTGMFGRLLVPAGQRERLCLPEAALLRIGQLEYVDVATENDLVERRLIQTGEQTGERVGGRHVEVLSGLASGETVLLND